MCRPLIGCSRRSRDGGGFLNGVQVIEPPVGTTRGRADESVLGVGEVVDVRELVVVGPSALGTLVHPSDVFTIDVAADINRVPQGDGDGDPSA